MHRILGTRRILFAWMFCILAAGSLHAQQSLSISSTPTPIQGLGSTTLDITLDSTAATEGFVLAIGFDSALLAANDLSISTEVDSVGAELTVTEIFADGATLGVVLDAGAPFNGQTIPASTGLSIAGLDLEAIATVGALTQTSVTFVDGVLNNPPLSNLLVQGGLSVDAAGGLGLNDGVVELDVPPPASLSIESTSIDSDSSGPVRVILDNDAGDTQGFVLSIAHDSNAVTLQSIDIVGTITDTVGAELVVPQVYANGGTLGVVLDFNSPFDGQVIPLGQGSHIANFNYSCNNVIEEPNPDAVTDLILVDGQFGSPTLDNIVVVSGLSLFPILNDGVLTCAAVAPPPPTDTVFLVGPRDLPTTGNPIGDCFPGEELELCFFYVDPTDNLQGLQMAICFDPDLFLVPDSFDITGTIVDEVGAEFVNFQVDNDPNDGDGTEAVIGILMDAAPPFENQMLPPTATPLAVGCVTAIVSPNAACGDTLLIDFCNGVNAAGSVSIENIVVIDYESEQGIGFIGGGCQIVPESIFQRGDCNTDLKVDLADAATVLGQQFSGLAIDCEDACDSNDDGKINLADSVYLLNYLFIFGPITPDPGPSTPGSDPTEDALGCDLNLAC